MEKLMGVFGCCGDKSPGRLKNIGGVAPVKMPPPQRVDNDFPHELKAGLLKSSSVVSKKSSSSTAVSRRSRSSSRSPPKQNLNELLLIRVLPFVAIVVCGLLSILRPFSDFVNPFASLAVYLVLMVVESFLVTRCRSFGPLLHLTLIGGFIAGVIVIVSMPASSTGNPVDTLLFTVICAACLSFSSASFAAPAPSKHNVSRRSSSSRPRGMSKRSCSTKVDSESPPKDLVRRSSAPTDNDKESECLTEATVGPLVGKWQIVKEKSDSIAEILMLVGLSFIKRKAMENATPINVITLTKNKEGEWEMVNETQLPMGITKQQILILDGKERPLNDADLGEWAMTASVVMDDGVAKLCCTRTSAKGTMKEMRCLQDGMQIMKVTFDTPDGKKLSANRWYKKLSGGPTYNVPTKSRSEVGRRSSRSTVGENRDQRISVLGIEQFWNDSLYRLAMKTANEACEDAFKYYKDFSSGGDEWINLGANKNVNCYRKDVPGSASIFLGQIEIPKMNWSCDDLADYIYHPSTRQTYDPQLRLCGRLALFPNFGAVIYQAFKQQLGVPGRDFLFATYKVTRPSGEIVIACRSFDAKVDNPHKVPECITGKLFLAAYIVTDSEGPIKISYINSADLMGSIPAFVTKAVFAGQLTSLSSLRDTCVKIKKDDESKNIVPMPVTSDEPFLKLTNPQKILILGQSPGDFLTNNISIPNVTTEMQQSALGVREEIKKGKSIDELYKKLL
eukprot:GHVL01021256.1.p2 GENE.GHVL01021256.1~~GHVL01021256.1.p2  ORF type:complete len:732 (-),score=118.57 GHVL01021256.1:578-2773(-)